MRKHLYLFAAVLMSITARASVGDTTWVQAHSVVKLTHPGIYDSTVTFPSGSTGYRKILMIFTIGQYACDAGSTYCHQWDYTVQNYLMTPGGDTLELSRFITPYSGNGTRFSDSWTNEYVFDVTDFYPILKNSATIRVNYQGYSYGFSGDVKFAFIEGTPDRPVVGIQKLYDGYFGHGNAIDPINNHLPAVTLHPPAGAQTADMRFIVSGHGSDDNGCCEFMSHYYDVLVNGSPVAHRDIWRSDCGSNEIYPQTGTWVFERANWCPGNIVEPIWHNLPGVMPSASSSVQIRFDDYISASPSGGYSTEAIIFYHGNYNKATDAAIEDIITPTNAPAHVRRNPICSSPVIQVRNTGGSSIYSMQIIYGLKDSVQLTYTWNGKLDPEQSAEIMLPYFETLRALSSGTGTYSFTAKIGLVNGAADADVTNNALTSAFSATPVWPAKIALTLSTNGSKLADGTGETSWEIYNMDNVLVSKRSNTAATTTYRDTVTLSPGCYRLVMDDAGCDGIAWWFYAYYTVNPGSGSFKVSPATSSTPKTLTGLWSGDFGCGFTQYFSVAGSVETETLTDINSDLSMEAYPNPAHDAVTVSIGGIQHVSGTLRVLDMLGRNVIENTCTGNIQSINVSSLVNGLYTIIFTGADNPDVKLQTRLMIAK